jgi:sarcosine oxidase, subunit beta
VQTLGSHPALLEFTVTHYDYIIIGAGVVGCSTAFHLAKLGARKILVLDRGQIGSGTTAQSSGILRTHYSVVENVELARRSWAAFSDFAAYVDDDEASAGLVKCGYMIASPHGDKLSPLKSSLLAQRTKGIRVLELDQREARELLPICRFDDLALIGFEPDAGFADAYLVATSFARSARRMGVQVCEGVAVEKLLQRDGKVHGVQTSNGAFQCAAVLSTQNIWTTELERWTGIATHVVPERHAVLALEAPGCEYTFKMPVYKDLGSPGMLYCRSYGGKQMLVSEGVVGETLNEPDCQQGDISTDYVVHVGEQVASRFPGYGDAGLASSWTGVYDVTPDWNPVLGHVPGLSGLVVGYGFSGHGFKLSPAIGRVLAQVTLGQETDVPMSPYALDRFDRGNLLLGGYGKGAVS